MAIALKSYFPFYQIVGEGGSSPVNCSDSLNVLKEAFRKETVFFNSLKGG
jgi:hypothetical protein